MADGDAGGVSGAGGVADFGWMRTAEPVVQQAKADPNDPQRCPVYGAMVQSLDENVGRLIGVLDELKLTENTIIVFFSDNGGNMYDRVEGIPPTSNAPLRGGKATLYEGGTREPCAVVWPGGSLAALAGQAVRLRLRLARGPHPEPRLYAIYVGTLAMGS